MPAHDCRQHETKPEKPEASGQADELATATCAHPRPNPVARAFAALLVAMIYVYRWSLAFVLGGRCRYWPTCSQYAIDAIGKYGPIRGSWRAAKRICRCHPFAEGGYDPA